MQSKERMASINYGNFVKAELLTAHKTVILSLLKHVFGLSVKTFQTLIQHFKNFWLLYVSMSDYSESLR